MRLQGLLHNGRVSEFFTQTDAHLFIGQVSVRKNGRLDIESTARNLNVTLDYDCSLKDSGAYDAGTAESWPRITINPPRALGEIELTFGHEVGHYFMDEVLDMGDLFDGSVHEPIAETFCETFGYMMSGCAGYDLDRAEYRARKEYDIPENYRLWVHQQLFEPA
jgi:hypothetical protein